MNRKLHPVAAALLGLAKGAFGTLGAADRYWYRLHLDDSRFQLYAEDLLCGFGLRPQTAATIVSALPQLMGDDAARGHSGGRRGFRRLARDR